MVFFSLYKYRLNTNNQCAVTRRHFFLFSLNEKIKDLHL